jgi:hypothetical protein
MIQRQNRAAALFFNPLAHRCLCDLIFAGDSHGQSLQTEGFTSGPAKRVE